MKPSTISAVLSKDSSVVTKLREKFTPGELIGSEPPRRKEVWLLDAVLQHKSLEYFRTCYSDIKEYTDDVQKGSYCNLISHNIF